MFEESETRSATAGVFGEPAFSPFPNTPVVLCTTGYF